MQQTNALLSRDMKNRGDNRQKGEASLVWRILFVFLWVFGSVSAAAQALVIPRTALPPVIDGVLEEVWISAGRMNEFLQIEPSLGKPSTRPGEVLFLHDDENLYIAARFSQPEDTLRGSNGRRDDAAIWDGDYLLVAFDPFESGNTAFYFVVNPANGMIDGILGATGNWSREWDGRVTTATHRDEKGWTAEVMVAFDSMGFQSGATQTWGVLAGRHFAQQRERSLDSIGDRNVPFRIDTFRRATFELAQSPRPVSLSPYVLAFGEWQPDAPNEQEVRGGLDLRWAPSPTVTLLATVKPDFAQLESDREVINVSDLPTEYPEKRPFFTESSDLYPGLAVNTRNIGEIVAGAKLRQVLPRVRYDVTAVLDEDDNEWLLGDARWTDSRRYLVEIIGGLKHAQSKDDYNITTNLRYWGFDKRLTAYTWFGTINGPEGGSNEWESVNSVQWTTRTFRAGLWNHFKSELYNPNIVGHNTLSNEVILTGFVEWSLFRDDGFVRKLHTTAAFDRYDLYTARGNDYTRFTAIAEADFVAPAGLGLWHGEVNIQPGTKELFRYRDPGAEPALEKHRDAFGPFVLVEQNHASLSALFSTDPSRRLAGSTSWKRSGVRGASSTEVGAELTLRLGSRSLISGSFASIDVGESLHQSSYSQTLQRAKVEHTFTNDLNVRLIYETNQVREGAVTSRPTFNLLVSWPVTSSTTIYVLSDQRRETVEAGVPEIGIDTRSVAIKVSHTLTGRW